MIAADSPTPVSAPDYTVSQLAGRPQLLAVHTCNPTRYPHLLESVVHGTPQARYDILFAFPGESLRVQEGGVDRGFLDRFEQRWRAERQAAGAASRAASLPPEAPPFRGGWFVYLAYELAAEIEPSLNLPASPGQLIALATRFPAALIHDHQLDQTYLVCERARHAALWPLIQGDVAQVGGQAPPDEIDRGDFRLLALEEEAGERYLAGLDKVKRYIREGDVFQVNLSRPWRATLDRPIRPAALYLRLRMANPAPFAGMMTLGPTQAVLSSSPERLVRVAPDGQVSTRPIAGTHPRGRDATEDLAQQQALARHPKERAEHIMLLDLERNDLGRVCQPGSVRVSELMAIETYRHVHHIVSEVTGRLRQDMTPAQVIRAVFPGGTITGCPKVRCMAIIAELEKAPRGAYTGSMGYINHDGSLDLNILIRTLTLDGRQVDFRAGSGLVADSQPQRELEETRAKARGLIRALEGAA